MPRSGRNAARLVLGFSDLSAKFPGGPQPDPMTHVSASLLFDPGRSALRPLCPWAPTPAALGVLSPVSSSKTLAFPTLGLGRRLALFRANDFSARAPISRLQSFASLQARRFACHPGRPYRSSMSVGSLTSPFSPCFQTSAPVLNRQVQGLTWPNLGLLNLAAVAFPSEQLLVCYLPKPRICQSSKPGN